VLVVAARLGIMIAARHEIQEYAKGIATKASSVPAICRLKKLIIDMARGK